MQRFRKLIQILFLLLIIIVPILNLLEIYFIKGTFISMDIGSLAVSDPLAVIQALFISHTFVPVMLASVFIPIIIVILFGRVWCSFACPYYLITDTFEVIRKKLKLKPLRPKKINASTQNIIRFALLTIGFILAGIFALPILYLFSPPSIISTQAIMIIKHFTITFEIIIIPIILILEFFFFYRFYCRYICPTGTCLSIFQSSRFGMKVHYSGNCSECLKCVKICPMMLDPRKDGKISNQCNNCGECISNCPDNKNRETLYFKI